MPKPNIRREDVEALKHEARLLGAAGALLLGVGLTVALALSAQALRPDGLTPLAPIAFGGVPVAMGYLACHLASQRLAAARKALHQRRP